MLEARNEVCLIGRHTMSCLASGRASEVAAGIRKERATACVAAWWVAAWPAVCSPLSRLVRETMGVGRTYNESTTTAHTSSGLGAFLRRVSLTT